MEASTPSSATALSAFAASCLHLAHLVPSSWIFLFHLTGRRCGDIVDELRSKSRDELSVPGAPSMDFVFTVCDGAASETRPIWPGHPVTAHWGVEDPAAVEGTDDEKRRPSARRRPCAAPRASR